MATTANDALDLTDVNSRLKEKLLSRMATDDDFPTTIEGLALHRRDGLRRPENCLYTPMAVVVLQGRKRVVIGAREYCYGENECFVNGLDMPGASHVVVASKEKPFLAISLTLDKYLLHRLIADMPPPAAAQGDRHGIVAAVDAGLLDAFLRLVALLDTPQHIPALVPLVVREIHYRLLSGPHGTRLRALNTTNTQGNRIALAVDWLRVHYRQPLQLDDLARRFHMATSTFHRHFKDITSLSPLQFQKRLRLTEAQRLMLAENKDAGHAALEVGYESPTQFNREYKRLFGEPPRRDVRRNAQRND